MTVAEAPFLSALLLAALGLAYGSFGGVVVERLPAEKSLLGRSKCPHCEKVLGPSELLPVVSYLWLVGRCRSCRKVIPAWSLLLEVAMACVFVLSLWIAPTLPSAIALAVALGTLLLIAVIDSRTKTIPDALSILLSVSAVLWALSAGRLTFSGAAVGVSFFGLQWVVSKGRWIGTGDILLALGIGLLVGGVREMWLCLLIAYIVGATVTGAALLLGWLHRRDLVPFGPFLAAGAFGSLLLSPAILPLMLERGL